MTKRLLLIAFLSLTPAFGQTVRENLEEAFRLKDAGKLDQAQELLLRSIAQAKQEDSRWGEAEARRRLGQILIRKTRYAEARAEFDRSAALFRTLGDRLGIGRIYYDLANLEGLAGNAAGRRDMYLQALVEFEAVGAVGDKAAVLFGLSSITNDPTEKLKLVREAIELARQAGDKRLEGLLSMRWGDALFSQGNFVESAAKIEQAVSLLEHASADRELGAALGSLGRVYRAHGFHERSLEVYLRALALQRRAGDPIGAVQSLNSISVAYSRMGKQPEALEYAEHALEAARKTGSALWIRRQLLTLASAFSVRQEYGRAVQFFEEAIAAGADPDDIPWRSLALTYRGLKDPRASSTADRAVEMNRRKLPEFLPEALLVRAIIRKEAGDAENALHDVEEGLQIVETQRLGAVPTDSMKRGFAEQNYRLFPMAVELLHQMGRHAQAVEVAERARGRAFLDLLATREQLKPRDQTQLAALQGLERELHTAGMAPSLRPAAGSLPLLTRGVEGPAEALWQRWQSADPELRSFVAAEPLSVAELAATASRLRSTLLVYWINELSTYIWVVTPGGSVDGVRVDVNRDQLVRRIRETWMGPDGDRKRGDTQRALALRGGEPVLLSGAQTQKDAWKQLYRWLILPVRHLLPRESGSLLTIVPHGPLFQVSFAALMDERGRYLIERHRLHYTPAGTVLAFTKLKKRSRGSAPPQYLLVADPAGMTAPDGRPLPALPGARREVRAIANLLPPAQVTVLAGDRAREQAVRTAAGGKAVVHFATHGILRHDEPSQSFLALAKSFAQPLDDGRLTAAEVYQLDLKADLVVLSACRSALGSVSSDGIVGLTRAFFYAGTPSVMATVWDVADEPTSRLISDFYRTYSREPDKSKALREAQLRLIFELRSGRVQASTPLGPLTLPENPLFWAGFVLIGEP